MRGKRTSKGARVFCKGISPSIMFDHLPEKTLVYFADPLCSWCYGISEELHKFKSQHPDMPIKVIAGGLAPYERDPMTPEFKQQLSHHWEQVEARTGLPFFKGWLEPDSHFIYNTELPSRAVTVASDYLQDDKLLAFFSAVQRAFYALGLNTNELSTYTAIAQDFGIDVSEFAHRLKSDEYRKRTHDALKWGQSIGVRSYPTLTVMHDGQLFALTIGYNTAKNIEETLQKVLGGNG